MNAVISRYLEEELPELRHSTANAYRSYLVNHIKPRWGSHSVQKMKPLGVELWLKQLALAPKTKGHLQNLLRVLFNCAMRWELVDIRENPMKLVRVRGGSKRTKEPKVLTIAQFRQLVQELNDPYRTMVILDLATGLRCSELFALKWCDVIWDDLTLLARRGIVDTVVSDVRPHTREQACHSILRLPMCCCTGSASASSTSLTTGYSRVPSRQARCRGSLGKCNSGISGPLRSASPVVPPPARRPRRHKSNRLAHIPPHVPESSRRDWGSDQSAAGTDAPCRYPNDDEHLRQGHGEEQTRGARQSRSSRIGFSGGLVPPYCPRAFLSR